MSGIVEALVDHQTLDQLEKRLAQRCDREGLDYSLVRKADSRGPVYLIAVWSCISGERVAIEGEDLAVAIRLVLAELGERSLA